MLVQNEQDYMEMISKKSACLFKASTECGAIAAKGSCNQVESLGAFGENFGLAYQIKDDFQDIFPFDDILPQDINEFRFTLPLIHFFKHSDQVMKENMLRKIGLLKTMGSQQKELFQKHFLTSLRDSGSWLYCEERINSFSEKAIVSLDSLPDSIFKTYLIEMGRDLTIGSKYKESSAF